jgi:hypothetical protein
VSEDGVWCDWYMFWERLRGMCGWGGDLSGTMKLISVGLFSAMQLVCVICVTQILVLTT